MTLLWFIILIGVLITVHELGHLVAARLIGVRVLKLSIGFGPKLVAWKRGHTEYAISAVPLGGYVRLLGEERGDEVGDADRPFAFNARPPWQRLLVILAGPLANVIFPVVVFTHLYAQGTSKRSATIGAVITGQPAADAGLKPGDRVIEIDGRAIKTWDDLNRIVGASAGRELRITVERAGGDKLTKIVTPRAHLVPDVLGVRTRVGLLGIAPHFRLPQIGVSDEKSAAAQAGLRTFDVITSIQGRPVANAADLEPLTRPRSGSMLVVTYLRPQAQPLGFLQLARLEPGTAQVVPVFDGKHYGAGVAPGDLFVHTVTPGTPAARLGGIGLRPGDVLLTLDGAPLSQWEQLEQLLGERPEDDHVIAWRSGVEAHEARFKLEPRRSLDEYQAEDTAWVFGAEPTRARAAVPEVAVESDVVSAIFQGIGRALGVTGTMVRVLGLTLLGRLPATSLGGPILIYQVAGVAAQHGVEQFLVMAALVSLNLGLLNLLPVPLLDGGQASLVLLEAVRRRPVSRRMRERAAMVGAVLLFALILLIVRNDILRHLSR